MIALLDKNKLAIVYPRQSTKEQVKENVYSTESQLKLRLVALDHGFPESNILVIEDDLGVSGRTIAGRIGMSKALRLVEEGQVAAVYAEDITRLSRDPDSVDHMAIAKQFRYADVLLYMNGGWVNMRDPGSRLSFKIQSVLAAELWSQTREKLYRSQRSKAEKGLSVTRVPRGYKKNKDVPKRDPDYDRLVFVDEEVEVIRQILARLPEVSSVRELFERCQGIYWPDGKPLTWSALKKLLRHPTYRGHLAWGDVFVENAHEFIISPEQAAQIDRMMSLSRATKRRQSARSGGLLSGLIWCESCARRMESNTANHSPAYRCQVNRPGVPYEYHFGVNAPKVDDAVLLHLWERLDAGLIEGIIERLDKTKRELLDARTDENMSRRALDRRAQGLVDSLAVQGLSPRARERLVSELNDVEAKLEAVSSRTPAIQHLDVDLDFYRRLRDDPGFIEALPLTWEDESQDWRRRWIRHFIDRVVFTQSASSIEITTHFCDGASETAQLFRRDWSREELAFVRALLQDPERPESGLAAWVVDRMREGGYNRTRSAIYKVLPKLQA